MWISKVPVDPATYDKNFLAPLPQGDQSYRQEPKQTARKNSHWSIHFDPL